MTEKDYDTELIDLKEKIKNVIGDEKIQKIKALIEISYKFDEKPNYKIDYNIND